MGEGLKPLPKDCDLPNGLSQSKKELIARIKGSDRPLSVDDLTEILGLAVKHDNENKVITILTMLLTYTEEDQINLGFFG
jgi:hypothetical protein